MDCRVVKVGSSLYFHVSATSVKAHQIEEGDVWQVKPEKLVARGVAFPKPKRDKKIPIQESGDGGQKIIAIPMCIKCAQEGHNNEYSDKGDWVIDVSKKAGCGCPCHDTGDE